MISPRQTLLNEAAAKRKLLLKLMVRGSKDHHTMREVFESYIDHVQAANTTPDYSNGVPSITRGLRKIDDFMLSNAPRT